MKRLAASWMAAVLAQAGCAQIPPPAGDRPAVLDGSATSAAALALTMEQVFGRPVSLAPDAFTKESKLILELTPARIDGVRIDGRETGKPEHFSLLRSSGECVLRRESTGERFVLRGANCQPR
jgi:hypothetical protein